MNNTCKNILIFAAGAAIGSLATFKFVKEKYERLAQEEIDSVKEVWSRKKEDDGEMTAKECAELGKEVNRGFQDGSKAINPNIAMNYAAELVKNGYIAYSDIKKEDREVGSVDRPYVIAPEEFGAYDDYETISLTYYADQILADEDDELVEDVDEIIGFDSLTHFGEYEDDSVFVRNDTLKADYEILLDTRRYSDVRIKRYPHPAED